MEALERSGSEDDESGGLANMCSRMQILKGKQQRYRWPARFWRSSGEYDFVKCGRECKRCDGNQVRVRPQTQLQLSAQRCRYPMKLAMLAYKQSFLVGLK